jgi:hypothetical protein
MRRKDWPERAAFGPGSFLSGYKKAEAGDSP